MIFKNGMLILGVCGILTRLYYACVIGKMDASAVYQRLLILMTPAENFINSILLLPFDIDISHSLLSVYPLTIFSWGCFFIVIMTSVYIFGLETNSFLYIILTHLTTLWNKRRSCGTTNKLLPSATVNSKDKLSVNWKKRRNKRILKLICESVARYSALDALNVACMCTLAYSDPEIQRILSKAEGWHLLKKLATKLLSQLPHKDIFHKSSYCLVLGDRAPEKSILFQIYNLQPANVKIMWHLILGSVVSNVDFDSIPGVLYIEVESDKEGQKNIYILSTVKENLLRHSLCFMDTEKCQAEHGLHHYFLVNVACKKKGEVPCLRNPLCIKRDHHAVLVEPWKAVYETQDMYFNSASDTSLACTDVIIEVKSKGYRNNNLV